MAIYHNTHDIKRQVCLSYQGLFPHPNPKVVMRLFLGFLKFFVDRVASVVDAFQHLIGDNVNGAVMAVTPRGKQYRFPQRLRAAKL